MSVCVRVSVQSNLRSCANTRATRNTYGFSVTRIVKFKKPFFQKLESYLLTVAKSAIFCAYSVRVIMYTRVCTRVRVYPSHARLGHGTGMYNYMAEAVDTDRRCRLQLLPPTRCQ